LSHYSTEPAAATKLAKKDTVKKKEAAAPKNDPEEERATGEEEPAKKSSEKKGKVVTMEAEKLKEIRGTLITTTESLNGMKQQIEVLSGKINSILEELPGDPE
jgi:hypothetical protein